MSEFLYFVDANMCEDSGESIKVGRVLLSGDSSTLPPPVYQNVQIDYNVAFGRKWVGGSVQPTSNGLVLIGGYPDSVSDSRYREKFSYTNPYSGRMITRLVGRSLRKRLDSAILAFAPRNPATGEITGKFERVSVADNIKTFLPFASHCIQSSPDGTKYLHIMGSYLPRGYKNNNWYIIKLDQSGRPVSVVENHLPDIYMDNNFDGGLYCFVQDNVLKVIFRTRNGIVPAYKNLLSNKEWVVQDNYGTAPVFFNTRHGDSFAFSSDGSKFWIIGDNGKYNYLVECKITPEGITPVNSGLALEQDRVYPITSFLIKTGGRLHCLSSDGEVWLWFSGNQPPNYGYCSALLRPDKYLETGHYSIRRFSGNPSVFYRAMFRGGVTYQPPSLQQNTPSVSISISSQYKNKVHNSIELGGSVSGNGSLYYTINGGTRNYGDIYRNGNSWFLLKPFYKEGLHKISVGIQDGYGNFVEDSANLYFDISAPYIDFHTYREKSTVFYGYVRDTVSGVYSVEIALTDDQNPSALSYTKVHEKGYSNGFKINQVYFCGAASSSNNPVYVYVRAQDNAGKITTKRFTINSSNSGLESPPQTFSSTQGVAFVRYPDKYHRPESYMEELYDTYGIPDAVIFPFSDKTQLPIFPLNDFELEIWWKYPPPSNSVYRQESEGFVIYDFDQNGQFSGGSEWGYKAYVYGRWEFLGKVQESDTAMSFIPATNWFPVGKNPFHTRQPSGNWHKTSVIKIKLSPYVDFPPPPCVTHPRKLLYSNFVKTEDSSFRDVHVTPFVWRLRLYALCNSDKNYTSSGFLSFF